MCLTSDGEVTDASEVEQDRASEDSAYEATSVASHEDSDEEMLDTGDILDTGEVSLDDVDKLIEQHDETPYPTLDFDLEHRCTVCDSLNVKACSGCEAAFYCSEEHQKEDWGVHGQFCRDYKALREPKPSVVRAVLLPVGSKHASERVLHKYMYLTYKIEKKPKSRCGYKKLDNNHTDIVRAVEATGGTVVDAWFWDEHPVSGRKLGKGIRIVAVADYKGAGLTRYLLISTQLDMKPKDLVKTYGKDSIDAHWDPRGYDVTPALISIGLAWVRDLHQK